MRRSTASVCRGSSGIIPRLSSATGATATLGAFTTSLQSYLHTSTSSTSTSSTQRRFVSFSANTRPVSSGAPPKKDHSVPYEEGDVNPVLKGAEGSNFAKELGGPAPLPPGMSTSEVDFNLERSAKLKGGGVVDDSSIGGDGAQKKGDGSFEVKQPKQKYFSRYADEMRKQQEYMAKIQSGELPPTTPPPSSANFRPVVPTSKNAGTGAVPRRAFDVDALQQHQDGDASLAEYAEGEDGKPVPPLARDEDIGEIQSARRRQRRNLVEAGPDGSVRVRKVPRSTQEGDAAYAAGAADGDDGAADASSSLDGRLQAPNKSRPSYVTKETAKYHAMSDKQLAELQTQYLQDFENLNQLGMKTDYSDDHQGFEDKWKPFLEYMSNRPISPKGPDSMSPKFSALVDGHNKIHGFYNPGHVMMTSVPGMGPEDTWYAQKFGSSAYAKPVADASIHERSLIQNIMNLTPAQKAQFRAIFSDFTPNDPQFTYHVLNSYPYASYLNVLVLFSIFAATYKLQMYFGAFDFYDEFLGLDFRRVPELEEPMMKGLSYIVTVMVFVFPCMLTTIAMQRVFRILSGRPVGPP